MNRMAFTLNLFAVAALAGIAFSAEHTPENRSAQQAAAATADVGIITEGIAASAPVYVVLTDSKGNQKVAFASKKRPIVFKGVPLGKATVSYIPKPVTGEKPVRFFQGSYPIEIAKQGLNPYRIEPKLQESVCVTVTYDKAFAQDDVFGKVRVTNKGCGVPGTNAKSSPRESLILQALPGQKFQLSSMSRTPGLHRVQSEIIEVGANGVKYLWKKRKIPFLVLRFVTSSGAKMEPAASIRRVTVTAGLQDCAYELEGRSTCGINLTEKFFRGRNTLTVVDVSSLASGMEYAVVKGGVIDISDAKDTLEAEVVVTHQERKQKSPQGLSVSLTGRDNQILGLSRVRVTDPKGREVGSSKNSLISLPVGKYLVTAWADNGQLVSEKVTVKKEHVEGIELKLSPKTLVTVQIDNKNNVKLGKYAIAVLYRDSSYVRSSIRPSKEGEAAKGYLDTTKEFHLLMFTQLQGYIPVRYDAAKGRIVATVCTPATLNGSISFDGNIDSVYKMDSVAVAPASIPQSPIAVSRLKSNSFSVSLQPGRYVLYGMSQKTKPRRLPLGEVTVGKAGAHISRTVTRAMLQKSLDPVERK